MNPRFPVYVATKGRYDTRQTIKTLEALGVPFFAIVEPQEFDAYAAVVERRRLLVLDPAYLRNYDTCDSLGDAKSKGPGAARNFAWDHALALGKPWHWVMDDNIKGFYRLNKNRKFQVKDGTMFRCMEDFVLRFENVAMAGPAYIFFTKRKQKLNPIILNTRIYSCNLIRNDVPFRWRGRYNEDTDLSLRMLKAKWCTIQFNAFLQDKAATQTIKGGCNADFYEREGTLPKSTLLVQLHPDVAELKWRWHRPHHLVHYARFKNNRLIRKAGAERPAPLVNEYGMRLVAQDQLGSSVPSAPFVSRSGKLEHVLVQGADVPGGHHCIYVQGRKPFVPMMRECNSVALRHSDVVVDIGAFVGTFAIRAARFPVRQAIAYEPTPYSFEVMQHATGLNLKLCQAAVVGDNRKEAEFFIGTGYGPTNSLFVSGNKNRKAIKVPCVNYADAVRGATVVKLDIEGGEYDLPILQPSVRAYIIDFHKTKPDWLERSKSIIAELEAAGFKPIIAPKWTNGFNRAGSWVRDLPDSGIVCRPLIDGKACCGCGASFEQPASGKAICASCARLWLPKHRRGFALCELSAKKSAPLPERFSALIS
jgi:FkbM family methyltransferase